MDLRALRESRGMSQQEMAEALGLTSKAYISQLETGDVSMPIRLALEIEVWSRGECPAVGLLSRADAMLLQAAIDRGRAPAEAAA